MLFMLVTISLHSGEDGELHLLRRHLPRVARALTKVVRGLHRLDERLVEYLQVLGKVHSRRGVGVSATAARSGINAYTVAL